MNNQEFNVECANLCGWVNLNDASFPEYLDESGKFYGVKDLLFDTDWNWIMEVVDKIEGLQGGIFQVDILQEGCCIRQRCKSFIDCTVRNMPEGTTKIQATVEAVSQFLTWYKSSFSN